VVALRLLNEQVCIPFAKPDCVSLASNAQ